MKTSTNRRWRNGVFERRGTGPLRITERECSNFDNRDSPCRCDNCDCSAHANLEAVLPPMADSISKYTGMVAIITLVGPCGQEGGDVIVQRYALCWPLFAENAC